MDVVCHLHLTTVNLTRITGHVAVDAGGLSNNPRAVPVQWRGSPLEQLGSTHWNPAAQM